ncbi:MAG: DUF2846 domain-containing protein [Burkholderiales bacterium]|nr:DUF2846 domain-containing protein [Burkholderiales bacterium]
MIKSICSAVVLALLSGCAINTATGPHLAEIKDKIPPMEPGKGRIYFYRTFVKFAGNVETDIQIDHKPVGRSIRGSFFFVDKEPGNYEIETTTEWEHKEHVSVAAGSTYYFQTFASMGAWVAHIIPEEHTADEALPDIATLAYIGPALDVQGATSTAVAAITHDAAVEVVPLAKVPSQVGVSTVPATPASANDQATVVAAEPPKTHVEQPTPAPATIATATVAVAPIASQVVPSTPKVLGSWSFEVEQMARQGACEGDGAWLTGKQNGIEIYQVNCTNGTRFVATCDTEACHPAS